MQFANLHQRDVPGPGLASRPTNGVYSSFELMVRAHRRGPTSSFLLCSSLSNALGLPQAVYLDSPRSRKWGVAVDRYRTLFVVFEVRSQDILLPFSNRRLYMAPHVHDYLADLDAEWEECLTR